MLADARVAGKHDGNDVDAAASKQKRGRYLESKKIPHAHRLYDPVPAADPGGCRHVIIPAGSYDYVDGVPVAGTYHPVEQNPQGVGDVLKAAFSGFYDAVDVCIFILMVGGFLGVVMKTGAVDAGVANIIRLLGAGRSG